MFDEILDELEISLKEIQDLCDAIIGDLREADEELKEIEIHLQDTADTSEQ